MKCGGWCWAVCLYLRTENQNGKKRKSGKQILQSLYTPVDLEKRIVVQKRGNLPIVCIAMVSFCIVGCASDEEASRTLRVPPRISCEEEAKHNRIRTSRAESAR